MTGKNLLTNQASTPAPRSVFRVLSGWMGSRWVRMVFAAAVLVVVFYQVRWDRLGEALASTAWPWLLLGLACFVPQWFCSTWRWRHWVAPAVPLSWSQAWFQQCSAAAMNLAMPGKAGELAKAGCLKLLGLPLAQATFYVVAEKAADLLALGLIASAAWSLPDMVPAALVPVAAAAWVAIAFRRMGSRLRESAALGSAPSRQWLPSGEEKPLWRNWPGLLAASVLLWLLHLGQILCFAWACRIGVGWVEVCRVVPLALVAGLLPVSWWGLGTREAVLAWFWVPPASLEQLVLLAGLLAARYLVPGLVGLAWLLATRPSSAKHPEQRWASAPLA